MGSVNSGTPLETLTPVDDPPAAFELAPPVYATSDGYDEEGDSQENEYEDEDEEDGDDGLTQQEKFEMDKKLFAQQMKEQLLGRPAKPAPTPVEATVEEEEVKHAAPVKEDLTG